MQDIRYLISRGLEAVGARPILLAAPFHIPDAMLEEFADDERVRGVVGAPREGHQTRIPVLGHWTSPEHRDLRLVEKIPETMLFLGTRGEIGGRILWECARKGIRQLYYLVDAMGIYTPMEPTRELKARVAPMILARLANVPLFRKIGDRILATSGISFERAYRELFERAKFLRLSKETFERGRVMIHVGTLGPGGAERQIAYCARGVARSGRWRIGVAVENLASLRTLPQSSPFTHSLRSDCSPNLTLSGRELRSGWNGISQPIGTTTMPVASFASVKGPRKRGGPVCLNRFSASISGAPAVVRLPGGGAAG
jgi:hypothetical protein